MMIDRLVEKKLVIKEKDKKDHRRSCLLLSEKGRKIYAYHKELNDQYYTELTEKLEKFKSDDFNKSIEIVKEIIKYWY